MTLRRGLAALLCLAISALGAGTEVRAGGVLRRAGAVEPESLDSQKTAGIPERMIDLDLFEGLTTYAADGRVVPGVAAFWEQEPNGCRWIFHLRHDARWSDGDPVTAEDFVYTLRRLVDPATASPSAYALPMIVNAKEIAAGSEKDPARLGVRAPDPYTVVIDLSEPAPFLPALLVAHALPVNRKAIEAHGAQWARAGNIVTNGPFVLAEWTPQSQIVLRRNPLYYAADQVGLDEVRWIVSEDSAMAVKRFRSGDLDISSVPPTDFGFVPGNFPQELHETPQLAVEYLVFNMRAEPLASNLALRQALALAIDRDTLNDKVDPAGEVSTSSFIPPLGTDYRPQRPGYAEIPERDRAAAARKLMTEAGYPPGTPLRLTAIYRTGRSRKKRLLSIAGMWKQTLGVELTIQNREWQNYLSALSQGDYQISLATDITEIADASDLLSAYRSPAGELNDAGYHNPAYDELVDQAEAEADPQQREHLLERAERLLLDDIPLVPLDNPVMRTLVSPRVTGWRDNIVGMNLSRYLGLRPAN